MRPLSPLSTGPPLPLPPTPGVNVGEAGAPGAPPAYGTQQGYPPQGYYYPPPPPQKSGSNGFVMIGIGAAIAIGVMKVMEFAGDKKGDMQSMMMQQMMKQAMKGAGGAPGGMPGMPPMGGAPGAFVRSVLLVLQRVLRLGHALLPSVNIMEIRANHEATLVRVVAMRAKLRAAQTMPGASRDLQTRLAVIEDALAEVGA